MGQIINLEITDILIDNTVAYNFQVQLLDKKQHGTISVVMGFIEFILIKNDIDSSKP